MLAARVWKENWRLFLGGTGTVREQSDPILQSLRGFHFVQLRRMLEARVLPLFVAQHLYSKTIFEKVWNLLEFLQYSWRPTAGPAEHRQGERIGMGRG